MELQFETNSSTKTHFSYSSIRSHFILNSSFPNPRCKHSFVYKSFLLVLMTSWGEVGTVEATRDGGEDDGGGNVADRIETGGLHCRLKPQSISSNIKTPIDFSTSRKEIRIEKKNLHVVFHDEEAGEKDWDGEGEDNDEPMGWGGRWEGRRRIIFCLRGVFCLSLILFFRLGRGMKSLARYCVVQRTRIKFSTKSLSKNKLVRKQKCYACTIPCNNRWSEEINNTLVRTLTTHTIHVKCSHASFKYLNSYMCNV